MGQVDRGEVEQEERRKRTENLHTHRDAKKAKEEVVQNVAGSMHEYDQHE